MLDLFSKTLRRTPYPVYARMRRFFPVLRVPRLDLWMLFDYDSVKRALLDADAFSSVAVPPGAKAPDWLLFADPPRHTRLRAIVTRAFTRQSIAALEPRIRRLSAMLLDESMPRGEMDFVQDYAALLPAMVIAEMMGIALLDLPRLLRWTEAIAGLSHAVAGGEAALRAAQRHREVQDEMAAFVEDVVGQRRKSPANDLFTRLVEAEVDGERLGVEDILGFFELLLSAGTDTASSLIASLLLCLIDHPHERERLERDPALAAGAIEETIRFRSPAQMVFRQTRRAVRLHGRSIPADRLVLAMVGSANRDAAAFADPDRFDVSREPNPHIAFGHGIHYCIGSGLARLEARVALDDVLARMRNVSLAGTGPWEPRDALHVHGPKRLPIRFQAAPASVAPARLPVSDAWPWRARSPGSACAPARRPSDHPCAPGARPRW